MAGWLQCCGSGSAWIRVRMIHIIWVTWIRIRINEKSGSASNFKIIIRISIRNRIKVISWIRNRIHNTGWLG